MKITQMFVDRRVEVDMDSTDDKVRIIVDETLVADIPLIDFFDAVVDEMATSQSSTFGYQRRREEVKLLRNIQNYARMYEGKFS